MLLNVSSARFSLSLSAHKATQSLNCHMEVKPPVVGLSHACKHPGTLESYDSPQRLLPEVSLTELQ